MKTAIVALAFLAVASAATIPNFIPIVSQSADSSPDGSYHSEFETANGIKSEEHGIVKNLGNKDAEAAEVAGTISYTAPDGTPILLKYIANELGFQAVGDHLPVAPIDTNTTPAIPVAILRSLEYNRVNAPKDEYVVRRV